MHCYLPVPFYLHYSLTYLLYLRTGPHSGSDNREGIVLCARSQPRKRFCLHLPRRHHQTLDVPRLRCSQGISEYGGTTAHGYTESLNTPCSYNLIGSGSDLMSNMWHIFVTTSTVTSLVWPVHIIWHWWCVILLDIRYDCDNSSVRCGYYSLTANTITRSDIIPAGRETEPCSGLRFRSMSGEEAEEREGSRFRVIQWR